MKRAFVLVAAASATAWLMTGCGKEEAPAPRVHHTPKPKTEIANKTVRLPKLAVPGTIGYLDLRNGFRDAVLGTDSSSFNDLVLKGREDAAQTATYTRSGDVLNLGGVPLQEIDYTFFKDRLAKITVTWKLEFATNDFSLPPSAGLAANCTQLYGRPQQHLTQQESAQYTWTGQRAKIQLSEIKLPGVVAPGGNWAIAPVTSGEMDVQSIPLSRDMDVYISSQSVTDNRIGL